MRALSVTLAAITAASCAGQTNLSQGERANVSARYVERSVALRQSHYYGQLYDENELHLLSPYTFADTYHIVDTEGEPIHPPQQDGLIPAGTPFIIKRVVFPDAWAMATRMLTTPRYHPWVYLKPAPQAPQALPRDQPYILLLPMNLETAAAVEREIEGRLGTPEEVTAWLGERRPTVLAAIRRKDVVEGMTRAELLAAKGPPQAWHSDATAAGETAQVAWYPDVEAWLVDGRVETVRQPRAEQSLVAGPMPLRPEKARAPAAATAPAQREKDNTRAAREGERPGTPAEAATQPEPGADAAGSAEGADAKTDSVGD